MPQSAGLGAQSPDSVYRAISQNDNHYGRTPRGAAHASTDHAGYRVWNVGCWEIKTPERTSAIGTRASANTSGPDFTWSRNPGEIADARDPHERRKPVSSA